MLCCSIDAALASMFSGSVILSTGRLAVRSTWWMALSSSATARFRSSMLLLRAMACSSGSLEAGSASRDRERLGVPADRPALVVAHVAQQRGGRRAQTEEPVLHHRLAAAERREEVPEVVEVSGVAVRRREALARRLGDRRLLRGLRVPVPRERRAAGDGDRAPAQFHQA